jgi:hypothetical protein
MTEGAATNFFYLLSKSFFSVIPWLIIKFFNFYFMPQARGQDFLEVDLSERKDEPRKKDLDNLVEIEFSKEKCPFKENMEICENSLVKVMDEYRVFCFMERRNLLSDEVDVTKSDFIKSKKKVEKQYKKLVCEATKEQYAWWINHTLDSLLKERYEEADPDYIFERLKMFKEARDERISQGGK